MAGESIAPVTATRAPAACSTTTSPAASWMSLDLSPWTRKSYRSSSDTVRPSRLSVSLRIEPFGAGPPAATSADSIVDWLGKVYTPGRSAGPTTNTLTARNWPSDALRLKLV